MLADLDELLLRCRDERAKAYINEALACYKAGAYRASIVSTWIAVTFDIIDKLRELALTGDKAATKAIEGFDGMTASHDVSQAQRFERDLLTLSKDVFELISPQEYIDLERLQTDRHRCAHPSQSSVGEVFSPTPELARFHIRNAVEHLLQHEPAQGKAALEDLVRTIESNYFPFDESKALVILGKTPLKRARPSLVRNLTVVLLKGTLREESKYPVSNQRHAALTCIRVLHPAQWIKNLQQNLSALIRALSSEAELLRAAMLLYLDSSLSEALEEDQVLRLSEFVRKLPTECITNLPEFLAPGPLLRAAQSRAGSLTEEEVRRISEISFLGLEPKICERIVEQFAHATNFERANDWGKRIQADLGSFSEKQLKEILKGAVDNDQVRGSFQLPDVLSAIRKSAKGKGADVVKLLEQVENLLLLA